MQCPVAVGSTAARCMATGGTQGVADELEHDLGIEQTQRLAPGQRGADPPFAEHVEVGHAEGCVQRSAQGASVSEDQRDAGALPQGLPAGDIVARQRILDEADDGVALQFAEDRE